MKIAFIDMSTKLQTIDDLKTGARGGMVSSLFAVPDCLSELGYETTVISDIKQGGVTLSGTRWIKESEYEGEQFDFLICNRGIGKGYPNVRARRRVLWTHDLPHNGFIPDSQTMNAFSGVVYMSQYAKRIWHKFYPILERPKSFLIPNGVNKDLFYPREKNLDYLLYISNPNRGIERLPLIYEATRTRLRRDIHLRAYSNGNVLHPNEGEDRNDLNYKSCLEAGIEVMDPIPQAQLAEELGRAAGMVLPTSYPEICSNAVLQSLASGTPVFTTGNLGATCEWVRHGKNGMLTEYQPHDYLIYQMEMVRNLIKVLNNPRVHRKMMMKTAQTRGIYTWKQVAKMWNKMLSRLY
jgi:glycosyltransferase involved in cell wall biosynthesis